MKKILSVLLLITILLSSFPVAVLAAEKTCDCPNAPIIYIRGRRELVVNKDLPEGAEGNYNLPRTDNIDVMSLVKQIVPRYCLDYLKNDFSKFTQLVCDILDEFYGDFCLNNNGEITNNSGLPSKVRWRDINWGDRHKPGSAVTTPEQATKEITKYNYNYDCRLDPLETADDLKAFVDRIKQITGHSKVRFLSRCEGNVILMAYFSKYGWEDADNVILYNSVARGTAVGDSLFSGYLSLDAQGTDYCATQTLDDTLLYEVIKDVVDYLKATYQLDLLFDYYNMTLPRVGREVLPEALLHCYGTTPGYWAMISADRYEAARDLVFAGRKQQYAGLLAKTDRYHEQVGCRIDEMLQQMKEEGVPVSIIAKYGLQLYPVTEENDRQSDAVVTVAQQAPGTTTAPIAKTFDRQYLEEQERLGNSAYISVDKCVNAATCLFPDTTWYIKEIAHTCYPPAVDELIYRIFASNGTMTVFNDEQFPQFLQYDEAGCAKDNGVLRPLSEEGTYKTIRKQSVFAVLRNLFTHLFRLIKDWISSKGN